MNNTAQKRAVRNYRTRQTQRGVVRFEIQALSSDRGLIRDLARRLTENGPDAEQARTIVQQIVSGTPTKSGGILDALRRSPLVGADLDVSRSRETGRKVTL